MSRKLEVDEAKEVAVAVLEQAIKDFRVQKEARDCQGNSLNALIWLASQAASPWFDMVCIDQGHALIALGWRDKAKEALKSPELSSGKRRALHKALEALDVLCS